MRIAGALVEHRALDEVGIFCTLGKQPLGLGLVNANGFFQNEMHPRLHRGDGQVGMRIVRYADLHQFATGLCIEFLRGTEALHLRAQVIAQALKGIGVDVADGGELCAWNIFEPLGVLRAHVADADDADFDWIHF